jgi:hypothetical protein
VASLIKIMLHDVDLLLSTRVAADGIQFLQSACEGVLDFGICLTAWSLPWF